MRYRHFLTLSVTTLIISSSSLGASDASVLAMDQLRVDHPNLLTLDRFGQIHKIVDKQLAIGKTPKATAESFIETWSPALDVDSKEFVERGPFPDRHVEQQLMYNPDTGLYKFTGVYYTIFT